MSSGRTGPVTSERAFTNNVTSDRPVYFIADSHLGSENDASERAKECDLTAFIGSLRGRASGLYLVGDIFDFWFEYPYPAPIPNPGTIAALSDLAAAGTSIHFLGGNHDYWAGNRLSSLTGARVHRGPLETTLFDRRLFVAHGDGLPEGDMGYRILRSIIRSRAAIAAFSLVPPAAGAAIARWASGLSEVTEERIERALPPMVEFMRVKLREGYDAVVVGHVHRQLIRRWGEGTGIIVGDWMTERSVVRLDASGFRALRWSEGSLREAVAA
ncbi:MAG: hypothetical protein GF400_03490 [Candidatus Eisenbacteria bacterium]|nr:hypothetical protein [Candidatus Eisenbacteria bacterium]